MRSTEVIDCRICKGSGRRYPSNPTPFCKRCNGMGRIRVGSPNYNCRICKGSGRRYQSEPTPFCGRCKGAGVVLREDIVEI